MDTKPPTYNIPKNFDYENFFVQCRYDCRSYIMNGPNPTAGELKHCYQQCECRTLATIHQVVHQRKQAPSLPCKGLYKE